MMLFFDPKDPKDPKDLNDLNDLKDPKDLNDLKAPKALKALNQNPLFSFLTLIILSEKPPCCTKSLSSRSSCLKSR